MFRQHKRRSGVTGTNKAGLLVTLCLLVSAQAYAVSTKDSIDAINQRLERIEQILQSQGLLGMLQQLEDIQQQISQLRGEIEVQNHTLEQLSARQRALYADLDQRIQRLETGGATAATAAPDTVADAAEPPLQTLEPVIGEPDPPATQQAEGSLTIELIGAEPAAAAETTAEPAVEAAEPAMVVTEAEPPQPSAPVPPAPSDDPIKARVDYEQAFNLLKQSLYDQAIKAFHQFLAAHPNSEYSDNAQYWLAEAYYVTHQYEQALAQYTNLVKNYPASQKLTPALLKIGYSKYELGQIDAAKVQLEELAQKYPGTTAARLAQERLIKINSATN